MKVLFEDSSTLKIGFFAKCQAEKNYLMNDFISANIKQIKRVNRVSSQVFLEDGTCCCFLSKNSELIGYCFDQIVFYNMLPNELLPENGVNYLLNPNGLPEEFDGYKIMYYDDNLYGNF